MDEDILICLFIFAVTIPSRTLCHSFQAVCVKQLPEALSYANAKQKPKRVYLCKLNSCLIIFAVCCIKTKLISHFVSSIHLFLPCSFFVRWKMICSRYELLMNLNMSLLSSKRVVNVVNIINVSETMNLRFICSWMPSINIWCHKILSPHHSIKIGALKLLLNK